MFLGHPIVGGHANFDNKSFRHNLTSYLVANQLSVNFECCYATKLFSMRTVIALFVVMLCSRHGRPIIYKNDRIACSVYYLEFTLRLVNVYRFVRTVGCGRHKEYCCLRAQNIRTNTDEPKKKEK